MASKPPELRRDGIGAQTLARLARAGLIAFSRKRVERDPFEVAAARVVPAPAVVLTGESNPRRSRG